MQRLEVRLVSRMMQRTLHIATERRADKELAWTRPSRCGTMPLLSSSGCCSAARCGPFQPVPRKFRRRPLNGHIQLYELQLALLPANKSTAVPAIYMAFSGDARGHRRTEIFAKSQLRPDASRLGVMHSIEIASSLPTVHSRFGMEHMHMYVEAQQ